MPDIPLSFERAEPMVSSSVIPGVAGCALEAGQFVYYDPATETYYGWQYGGPVAMPRGIAVTAAQPGQVVQIMAHGVFRRFDVAAPLPRTVSGMAMEAAQPGQVVQIMVQGLFPALDVVAPLGNTIEIEPGAAPGSICEQCFDAPAVVLRAAPWGGDMGMCLACVAFPGEET